MGTLNGWQTPKTNWQSADVVGPTDFNRIEGNVNAIETGERTIDSAQAPASDVGSLRQLLDWFANRIKAITGKTNWYDAPDITLAALAQHKPRHASGGADALAPADIGAASQSALDAHLAEKASQTQYGHVKVDGTTITATDGVISAVSGGGGFSANCQATNLPNNSEVRFMRFTVPAGKTLKIKAASVYPSGITNLVVQVYNLTGAAVVYSTNSSFAQGDLASVAAGNEVVFRVNNTSGAERTGCIGWIAFEVV